MWKIQSYSYILGHTGVQVYETLLHLEQIKIFLCVSFNSLLYLQAFINPIIQFYSQASCSYHLY